MFLSIYFIRQQVNVLLWLLLQKIKKSKPDLTSNNHTSNFNIYIYIKVYLFIKYYMKIPMKATLAILFVLVVVTYAKYEDDCVFIGISLGSTQSCVSIFKNGKIEVIPYQNGSLTIPSIATFQNGKIVVGQTSKYEITDSPKISYHDLKKLIGRAQIIEDQREDLPYEIVNKPYIRISNTQGRIFQYAPQEILEKFFEKMKEIAVLYAGQEIKNAIVTVPVYFNNKQRETIKYAGSKAGLNIIRIIKQPSTAVFPFYYDLQTQKTVLVLDIGESCDATILVFDDGVYQVISENHDSSLGGDSFNQRIVDYFLMLIKNKENRDLSNDKRARAKLLREAEKAKIVLSSEKQVKIEVKGLVEGFDFSEILTRSQFEQINADLFQKMLTVIQVAIQQSIPYLNNPEIDDIILLGGSAKIPKIKELVTSYFKGKQPKYEISDQAICFGAAFYASVICQQEDQKYEIIPYLSIVPLSLGIESMYGLMTNIIPKGSLFPIKLSTIITEASEDGDCHDVNIKIFMGERPLTRDNYFLGNFTLACFSPSTNTSFSNIQVIFEVDTNLVLIVRAIDEISGKQNSTIFNLFEIVNSYKVDQMLEKAQLFKENDSLAKEKIQLRKQLINYLKYTKQNVTKLEKLTDKQSLSRLIDMFQNATEEAQKFLEKQVEANKQQYEERKKQIQKIYNFILEDSQISGSLSYEEDL